MRMQGIQAYNANFQGGGVKKPLTGAKAAEKMKELSSQGRKALMARLMAERAAKQQLEETGSSYIATA